MNKTWAPIRTSRKYPSYFRKVTARSTGEPLIYSLSLAPVTETLFGARSLVLGCGPTLTYCRPPLFLGTARKTR